MPFEITCLITAAFVKEMENGLKDRVGTEGQRVF